MCCIEMHIVCSSPILRFGTALMCLSTAVTLLLHCRLFPACNFSSMQLQLQCSPADVSCCCKCMQQGCSSSLAVGITSLQHGHQGWDGATSTRFTLQGTTVITVPTMHKVSDDLKSYLNLYDLLSLEFVAAQVFSVWLTELKNNFMLQQVLDVCVAQVFLCQAGFFMHRHVK